MFLRMNAELLKVGYLVLCFPNEAYSAAGKIHLHQQVENQKEHAI